MTKKLALAAFAALLSFSGAALAFPATVVLKIGSDPGSISDNVGRVVADYLGAHLPGNPQVVVENNGTANGLVQLKMFATVAAGDGSEVGFSASSPSIMQVTDPKRVDFDTRLARRVGSLAAQASLCVTKKDSGKTLETPDLVAGSNRPGSPFQVGARLAALASGNSSIKIVQGFGSERELAAALDRGEIDIYCGLSYSTYMRESRVDTQSVLGGFGPAEVLASVGAEDLMTKLSADDQKLADLLLTQARHFFILYLPASATDEVLAAYRSAFDALVVDPDFIKAMGKYTREYKPSAGSEVEAAEAMVYDADRAIVARAAELMK